MNVTIDCAAIGSREELHRTFSDVLSFPSCYGRNLDALYDQLTSLSGTIRLKNWKIAETNLAKYGISARRVISHAVQKNESLIVIF